MLAGSPGWNGGSGRRWLRTGEAFEAIGVLEGAVQTKGSPAVVIGSATYLTERPDILVGILTTRPPRPASSSDYSF